VDKKPERGGCFGPTVESSSSSAAELASYMYGSSSKEAEDGFMLSILSKGVFER
jgi:hypothetical protein